MFHFPAFPPTSLYIQLAVTHHEDEPGFPIRKSSDHSPVIGSPRLIADSHVLHRLLMPRHPPCALNNLHTIKKNKNLKSTIKPTQSQFNANSRRCSRPLYSSQTTTHNTTTTQPQQLHHHHARQTKEQHTCVTPKPNNAPHPTQNQHSTHEQNHPSDTRGQHGQLNVLLRKEVIQPHLPVRLPCYDLVPIANPTLDGSLPKGLGHRLWVLPTFVT